MSKLRIWHLPERYKFPFYVDIETPEEGWIIANILLDYDNFCKRNCTSGLEQFNEETQNWEEWEDEYGYSLWEYVGGDRGEYR